jgi:hypothetical protein
MIDAHYIGMWPQSPLLTLGLWCSDGLRGCAVFSPPPKDIAAAEQPEVWELSRLWIADQVPRNAESFLIGRAIRYIKKNHTSVRTLISFADPGHGHSGVIYRATNWREKAHRSKHLFTYAVGG